MTQTICDRCGKVIKGKYNRMVAAQWTDYTEESDYAEESDYTVAIYKTDMDKDLCDECYAGLVEWMKGEK